jgi:hypothetical protein
MASDRCIPCIMLTSLDSPRSALTQFSGDLFKNQERPIHIRNFSRPSSLLKDIDRLEEQADRLQAAHDRNNSVLTDWAFNTYQSYFIALKEFIQILFSRFRDRDH